MQPISYIYRFFIFFYFQKDYDDLFEDHVLREERINRVSEWIKIVCLLIIAIVALGIGLIYLEFLLVPLVLARFCVYLFQPFINYLVGKKAIGNIDCLRIRLPRPIAVVISFFVVLVLATALVVVIFFSRNYQIFINNLISIKN